MEIVSIITSAVVSIVGASSVQLFFFRQTRKKLQNENTAAELENKSKQAEEWRKLYEEERSENIKKDELIKTLYKQVDEERQRRVTSELNLAKERGVNGFLRVIKCKRFECGDREPPYKEIAELAERGELANQREKNESKRQSNNGGQA